MNSVASAPLPVAASPATVTVPHVTDVELAGAVTATAWPPVATAALPLRQAWLAEPEPAFRRGQIGLAATDRALLVFAELTDDSVLTTATADDEPLWERGDVFEIFLQSFGAEAYSEFQVAPSGHRLQLAYPWIGAVKANGIAPYIRRDRAIDLVVHIDPANARWRVAARIPIAPLLASQRRSDGREWRVAFCRYDYDAAGRFCLSSTAALTRPDFHRIGEWSRATVPGGFPLGGITSPPPLS